jgi:DNA-binding CsgD family transcriptional regulator
MVFVHHETLDRAARWVERGSGVVIDGDTGSGRSAVLDAIARHHVALGVPTVVLRCSAATATLPLGPFLMHQGFAAEAAGGVDAIARVSQKLGAELDGTRALLVVDDAEHLDPTTVAVLDRALLHPHVLPVLVVPWGFRPDPVLARLLRSTSRLTVPSLDLPATTAVLAAELEGPVAAPLAATVQARSAGNPTVALALIRAAVWSGEVSQVAETWTETGSLEQASTGAVAQAMLGPLAPGQREALETLAWFGVTDLEQAEQLIGRPMLEALADRGRVALQPQGSVPLVTVRPRSLGRALRSTVSPLRHEALVAQARALALPGEPVLPSPAAVPEVWWQSLGERGEAAQRSLTDAVTVIFESLQAQVGLRSRRWTAEQSVANAVPLLRLALLDGVPGIDVDDVFARTVAGDHDDLPDVASYVMLRAEWSSSRGRGFVAGLQDDPDPRLRLPAPEGGFAGAMDLLAAGAAPITVDRALADLDDAHPMVREMGTLQHVHALFDAGRPAEALELLDAWPAGPFRAAFHEHLAALRGDALLFAGRMADAERWARANLRSATERLNGFGIRMAARGLANALFVLGDLDGAGDAVGAGLGLGRSGPLVSAFDERLIAIGAAVHARQGRPEMAKVLLEELERGDHAYRPTLDMNGPWVRCEIAVATGTDVPQAVEALWARGAALREEGSLLGTLMAWTMIPVPLSDDRAAALAEVWAQVDAPMLRALTDVHLTLPHGTPEQILRSLAPLRNEQPIIAAAVAVAEERARAAGEQIDAARAELLGGALGRTLWSRGNRGARPEPLSDREREIVLLARGGLSNREIASQLFVSVRTVESHLYRAMRKLDIGSRAELASWSPVGQAPEG